MPDNEEKDDKKWFKGYLRWAIILTGIYALTILVIRVLPVISSVDCKSNTWWLMTGGCLTLNELGDFLAGAFAPVAFIWLVAAVLIQSQELKAQQSELREQRNELKLTRTSMDNSRKVMKAQADEAKAQTEFIGTQTAILQAEQVVRENNELRQEIDANIELFVGRLLNQPKAISFRFVGDDGTKFGVRTMRNEILEDMNNLDAARIASFAIIKSYDQMLIFEGKLGVPLNLKCHDDMGFIAAYESIYKIRKQYEQLPVVAKIKIDLIETRSLIHAVNGFAERAAIIMRYPLENINNE